jgi:3'-phosphoadenosine 5'-phosphosulfate sulfotransferase (PAPS reductase)/FAD synthetase
MNPILLGKLKRYESGRYALIGGEGDLKSVRPDDVPVLRAMNGFDAVDEIAAQLGCSAERVDDVYERYAGDRFLVPLSRWNKLRWCEESRTYVNAVGVDRSPIANGPLVEVPLSPPCDPWFCVGDEREWLRGLIERRIGRPIPEGILLLANNGVVGRVFFWEVVAQGKIVLRIDFTGETEDDWTYTFSPAIEEVAWDAGMSAGYEEERDRHIAANSRYLEELAANSIAFIEEICSRSTALPLIYFSGGKESVVTMHLFKEAGISAQLLFAAQGMDFPEDEQFIQELAKMLRESPEYSSLFRLHIEEGDLELAIRAFEREGRLHLDNMWCRSELKYPNRNRAVEKLYPDGAPIAFEGSRWYENDFRRSHPRVNFITDIRGYRNSQQVWAHALADWNGFDVWSYIYANRLPINPLYEMGFQRTTCWSCPLVNPYHLQQSKRYRGDLWARIAPFEVAGFEKDQEKRLPTETPF